MKQTITTQYCWKGHKLKYICLLWPKGQIIEHYDLHPSPLLCFYNLQGKPVSKEEFLDIIKDED